jgi:hypothetical protein
MKVLKDMFGAKKIVKKAARFSGLELRKIPKKSSLADPRSLGKANTFLERYREIISDPLNMMINRVPEAGYFDGDGLVILHNGHRIPVSGDLAYYDEFSDILVINRGVHEPLEEYCFQEVLKKMQKPRPVMIELGAYWAHYSMWLLKTFPGAKCTMVEPDQTNMKCGKNNFQINGYEGEFINSFVGRTSFTIDDFCKKNSVEHIDILHSDIQGFEVEMLEGAKDTLSRKQANYVFVSTHSEKLHVEVERIIRSHDYRIEVSSGYDKHTTSSDGFVLASSPAIDPVFKNFSPMGRLEIAKASPQKLAAYVNSITVGS